MAIILDWETLESALVNMSLASFVEDRRGTASYASG